jgi:hypothetical protein
MSFLQDGLAGYQTMKTCGGAALLVCVTICLICSTLSAQWNYWNSDWVETSGSFTRKKNQCEEIITTSDKGAKRSVKCSGTLSWKVDGKEYSQEQTIYNLDLTIKDKIDVPIWYKKETPDKATTRVVSPGIYWIITAIVCIVAAITVWACKYFQKNKKAAAMVGAFDMVTSILPRNNKSSRRSYQPTSIKTRRF